MSEGTRNGAEGLPSGVRTRPRLVLVADDDPDALDMVCEMVSACGCVALTARTAREAVAIVQQTTPHMALIDLGLADAEGVQLAEQLRLRCGEGVILVAITGWLGATSEQRARAAGYHHYLVKPFAPDVLRRLLALVCAHPAR